MMNPLSPSHPSASSAKLEVSRSSPNGGQPVSAQTATIECEGIAKRFGQARAVEDVTFTVERGSILALVGHSGCGKTTLLRLIAGFERPDEGSILLEGRPVAGRGVWVSPESRGIGMVFQDYALFPHLTVQGNVAFGLNHHDRAGKERRVLEALQMVGLAPLADRYPHQLSGGEQQRVALARSLAPQPAALLLDEPFSNLDTSLRLRLRREVREILRASQVAAIYVTHDQREALFMGDRLAVMNQGRLEQVGLSEELYERPASRFTAAFLGPAIFLRARVVTEGFQTSDLGLVQQQVPPEALGAWVELLVRPDDITLIPSPGAESTVVEREFHGPHCTYTVRLPSGRRVEVIQHHSSPLREGERVAVSLTPGHSLWYFPEGAASAPAVT